MKISESVSFQLIFVINKWVQTEISVFHRITPMLYFLCLNLLFLSRNCSFVTKFSYFHQFNSIGVPNMKKRHSEHLQLILIRFNVCVYFSYWNKCNEWESLDFKEIMYNTLYKICKTMIFDIKRKSQFD